MNYWAGLKDNPFNKPINGLHIFEKHLICFASEYQYMPQYISYTKYYINCCNENKKVGFTLSVFYTAAVISRKAE